MAPAFILMGSILGFLSGLLAYVAMDTSLLVALAIWVGAGPVSAILAILVPRGPAPARTSDLPQTA